MRGKTCYLHGWLYCLDGAGEGVKVFVRPLVKYTYVRQNKAGARRELGG